VPTPCNKDTLAVCVQITVNGQNTNILNLYYPDGCTGRSDWLTGLSADKDWVIVGDFNSHHPLWGGTGTQARGGGAVLAENILNSDLYLLNDGSPTRLPDRNDHNPSAIDKSDLPNSGSPHPLGGSTGRAGFGPPPYINPCRVRDSTSPRAGQNTEIQLCQS
jgi:hypothetical protein